MESLNLIHLYQEKVENSNIMQSPINKKLEEIRYMSYYDKHKEIYKYIVFYLRFDIFWYKVLSCDGESEFVSIDEPKIINLQSFREDELAYPISQYDDFKNKNFEKLLQVQECLWKGKEDASYGFLLSFEKNRFITIIDYDDCLSLKFEKDEKFLKDSTLVKRF